MCHYLLRAKPFFKAFAFLQVALAHGREALLQALLHGFQQVGLLLANPLEHRDLARVGRAGGGLARVLVGKGDREVVVDEWERRRSGSETDHVLDFVARVVGVVSW